MRFLSALVLISSVANASIVEYIGVTDAHHTTDGLFEVLDIRANKEQEGGVEYTGSHDRIFGDAVRGRTYSASDLSEILDFANKAIGIYVNINSTGNSSHIMDILNMNIYGEDGTLMKTISYLGDPVEISGPGHNVYDAYFMASFSDEDWAMLVNNPEYRIGLDTYFSRSNAGFDTFSFGATRMPAAVPEPSSILLMIIGMFVLSWKRIKKPVMAN